jgi:hypothetical protein
MVATMVLFQVTIMAAEVSLQAHLYLQTAVSSVVNGGKLYSELLLSLSGEIFVTCFSFL